MRYPNDSQHLTIVGRNGTGKTQAAAYHLSLRSWDQKPWIVFDFKFDELLNSIKGVRHIGTSEIPKQPGIYLVHPQPDDFAAVVDMMWKIWERENVGVYVDEGYMVCSPTQPNPAYRSLLTQGRSKNIPVVTLSQRPVWLDRFVFSESTFYQIFALNDARDRKTVESFAPVDLDVRLPNFYSWYYDVGTDECIVLKPVPDKAQILERFAARMQNTNRRTFI